MTGARRGAVVAAVLLALAATGCADGSPRDPSSPRGKVQLLAGALSEADAGALRELVVDDSMAVSAELLTDEVLEQGAFARSDVSIDETGDALDYLAYDLDTNSSGDTGDTGRPWLQVDLSRSGDFSGSALPVVQLEGRGITALRVGDAEVRVTPLPAGGRRYYLPPGRFTVTAVGPTGLVTHDARVRVDTREPEPYAQDLGGELTAAGRARVQRAADRFVRRCTRPLKGSRPAECPASVAFVGGLESSSWTLDGPVRVTTEKASDGWRIRTEDPRVARMRGTVLDRRTNTLEPVTDRVPFRVGGTVTAKGDRLVVEIPGY